MTRLAIIRAKHEFAQRAAAVWAARAELLLAVAFLSGWLLFTHGVALYVGSRAWPLSIGLLLLSLCGWKWIGVLTTKGLYTLTTQEREDG